MLAPLIGMGVGLLLMNSIYFFFGRTPPSRVWVFSELITSNLVYREIYEHGLLEREFAERVEARA